MLLSYMLLLFVMLLRLAIVIRFSTVFLLFASLVVVCCRVYCSREARGYSFVSYCFLLLMLCFSLLSDPILQLFFAPAVLEFLLFHGCRSSWSLSPTSPLSSPSLLPRPCVLLECRYEPFLPMMSSRCTSIQWIPKLAIKPRPSFSK